MFKQGYILIGFVFVLNIVNILMYNLGSKISIFVNRSFKSIPKIRIDTHNIKRIL